MSDKPENTEILQEIVQRRTSRRNLLATAGLASLGALAIAPGVASAQRGGKIREFNFSLPDNDILNFALNLEYLEAEYYLRAAFGRGLDEADTTGVEASGQPRGEVIGGRQVTFDSNVIRQYAEEIALDEEAHVKFLRAALGPRAVARPTIDISTSFDKAAQAAGIGSSFDPYANENNFLLGAFVFEDVGVTAYKGASPFINKRAFREAVAGLLAVEAYHASEVRTVLYGRGQSNPALIDAVQKISDLRDAADNVFGISDDRDQGIVLNGKANIVPADENALAFSRTFAQVLNIVYLGGESAGFGFFPNRLNGRIR